MGAPVLALLLAVGLLDSPPAVQGDAPKEPCGEAPVLGVEDPERYRRPWAAPRGKATLRFARAVFWIGALWDAYTTQRGLDAGLHEGNPFVSPFTDEPDLATIAVTKAISYTAFELVGRRGWTKTRNALLLSTGFAQLGVGFANFELIQAAEEQDPAAPRASGAPPP